MKSRGNSFTFLLPFVVGLLSGGIFAYAWSTLPSTPPAPTPDPFYKTWPPSEFRSRCHWQYLLIKESGWATGAVGTFEDFDLRLTQPPAPLHELFTPIFPTVFRPTMADKLYYDAILESDIAPGDKVLVIGPGSGADAWVAFLKSQSTIYAVDINPMAIVNTRTTALIAGFEVRAVTGNVNEAELPPDFGDFDYVLWNMPFYWSDDNVLGDWNYHDGDDGTILTRFLERLPVLLKPDGQAIVLNTPNAKAIIGDRATMTATEDDATLFIIPNQR